MTRAKLLATSILASAVLLGTTAATQAAYAQQAGQVAVDQSTRSSTAQSGQTTKAQANPALVAQNDSGDRNGAEDNDRDDQNGVEDDDRDDRGQTGENEGGQTGENEGEHED